LAILGGLGSTHQVATEKAGATTQGVQLSRVYLFITSVEYPGQENQSTRLMDAPGYEKDKRTKS
jgi:hypothetical protein